MGKTIQQAVENLRAIANTPVISQRYQQGVEAADWATPTQSPAAAANWFAGVTQANADGRYQAGVQRVTNQEWRQMSVQKGAAIIGQRIVASLNKYQARFGPILQAMNTAAAALPPRTSSASQNIQQRLLPVVQAAMQAAGKSFN